MMVYKTLFLTVDYMPFKPETYRGVLARDVKGNEVERICSAEGMEADLKQLTLNLAGVCNAKILDSSFENFRLESTKPANAALAENATRERLKAK